MARHSRLKQALVAFAFIGLFSFGYLTTSVMTACKAEALLCCGQIAGGECLSPFTGGTSAALTALNTVMVVAGIIYAALSVGLYYIASLLQFAIKVFQQIGVVIQNWVGWWDTFWFYDLQPALQDMSKQLSLLEVTQARLISGFKDAAVFNKGIAARMRLQNRSFGQLRPGENVCVAGSLSSGMNQAKVIAGAYTAAVSHDRLNRTAGAVGTTAAGGKGAVVGERFQNYVNRYCDAGNNRGHGGCATSATFANLDLDVPGQIFLNMTIDLKNPDVKKTVDDIVINVVEPFVPDPLPADTFRSAQGQQNVIEREGLKARRQAAYGAIYHIVGRRAPGSGTGDPAAGMALNVSELIQATGVPPDGPAAAPSENQIMEMLAVGRNRTGTFSVDQMDEPENNAREAAIQAGIRTRQLHDLLELTDRLMIIVAAQIGGGIAENRPYGDKAELVPKQE